MVISMYKVLVCLMLISVMSLADTQLKDFLYKNTLPKKQDMSNSLLASKSDLEHYFQMLDSISIYLDDLISIETREFILMSNYHKIKSLEEEKILICEILIDYYFNKRFSFEHSEKLLKFYLYLLKDPPNEIKIDKIKFLKNYSILDELLGASTHKSISKEFLEDISLNYIINVNEDILLKNDKLIWQIVKEKDWESRKRSLIHPTLFDSVSVDSISLLALISKDVKERKKMLMHLPVNDDNDRIKKGLKTIPIWVRMRLGDTVVEDKCIKKMNSLNDHRQVNLLIKQLALSRTSVSTKALIEKLKVIAKNDSILVHEKDLDIPGYFPIVEGLSRKYWHNKLFRSLFTQMMLYETENEITNTKKALNEIIQLVEVE